VEEGKDGEERRRGREKVGRSWWVSGRVAEGKSRGKVGRDCAVLKIPLKSPGPGPSLTLRQIDAPANG